MLFQVSIYFTRFQRVEFGIISICRIPQQGVGENYLPLGKDPVGLLLGTIFAFWRAFAFRGARHRRELTAKCIEDVYVIGVLSIKTRFAIHRAKEEVDCIRLTVVVAVTLGGGEKANFSICLTIETRGNMKRGAAFEDEEGGGEGGGKAFAGDLPVIYNVHDIIIFLAFKLWEFGKLFPNLAIAFIDRFPKSRQISISLLPAAVMENIVRIAKGFRVFDIKGSPGGAITIAVEGCKSLFSYFRRLIEKLVRVKQQPDTSQAIDVADNRH